MTLQCLPLVETAVGSKIITIILIENTNGKAHY